MGEFSENTDAHEGGRADRSAAGVLARLEDLEKKAGEKKAWYKTMSGIVAVAAFALSVLSTLYSYKHDADQELQEARSTLNTLGARLLSLPKENFELKEKYKHDGNAANNLGSLINTENIVLVDYMRAIVDKFPVIVTDADRYILASSMSNSGRVIEATKIFGEIAAKSQDPNSTAAAYRNLGAYSMAAGDPENGRRLFQQAVDIFDTRFAGEAEVFKRYSKAYTYLMWARSELWTGDCDHAEDIVGRANALMVELRMLPESSELQLATEISGALPQCRALRLLPAAGGAPGPGPVAPASGGAEAKARP